MPRRCRAISLTRRNNQSAIELFNKALDSHKLAAGFGSNGSSEPSGLNRATPRWNSPLTTLKLPAMTIFPSLWIRSAFTSPFSVNRGLNEGSSEPGCAKTLWNASGEMKLWENGRFEIGSSSVGFSSSYFPESSSSFFFQPLFPGACRSRVPSGNLTA